MNIFRKILIATLAFSAFGYGAHAQTAPKKLKIGLVLPLSGPFVVLGEQVRDGFLLAVENAGGKLGGLDTEVTVVDDENKPDVAVRKTKELLERGQVDFVVGPISVAILQAIRRPVLEAGAIFISPNSGPSIFAGAECKRNFFVTSYQNDQIFATMGKHAQESGYKRVFLLVPNYQAGKDAVAGFKSQFKGEIAGEIYTPVGNVDFSSELAQIAVARPDALYTFMPGGMGVNLVKQYRQAGLESIPFLSSLTVDETTLPAQRESALGLFSGAHWTPNLDNERNKAFVEAFLKKTGKLPATYAMQGYDTAELISASVKGIGGKLEDKDALIAQLRKADFQSLRGNFKFGPNHYPIQDFYLAQVGKRREGLFETQIVRKVFENFQDGYADQCKMQ